MKIDREKVYRKYGGKCAYCGINIEKGDMQVDHIFPNKLKHDLNSNYMRKLYNIIIKNIDDIENLNPSCRKCNIHKHGMRLEVWRNELKRQVEMLRKNPQFDRALRFGLVEIIDIPVVFYFEK
jgi:5-methylcytosine-specific restriction endonuclease McrA